MAVGDARKTKKRCNGKYFGALLTDLSKAFDCLSHDSINLVKWFVDNQMKVNSDKCHFITSKQSCMNLKIGNINIENSTCQKTTTS